jgi:hypothetical protein
VRNGHQLISRPNTVRWLSPGFRSKIKRDPVSWAGEVLTLMGRPLWLGQGRGVNNGHRQFSDLGG